MKRLRWLIAPVLALVVATSCATKPPTPVEPGIETAPDLATLRSETEALRKRAFDLGLKDLMSEAYADADARYVEGVAAQDSGDTTTAVAKYSDSKAKFEALLSEGVALRTRNKKAGAESARKTALSSGAAETAAERVAAGEARFAAAEALAAAGKHEEAYAEYEAARLAWDAADRKARALAAKAEIDDNDWSGYDPGNYALAGERLAESDRLFPTDPPASLDASEEALLRYNIALDKGYQDYAGERKGSSDEARIMAQDIKANVAVKDDYAAAQSVYDRAIAAFSAERYREASKLFEEAERLFAAAYESSAAKRAAALKALSDLEAAQAASDARARDAGSGE